MNASDNLKPGWRTVRFGDVVRDVKNTTKDPVADELDRVVGLDHLDPASLPLRRWDELSELLDGTSFTRTFKAGQVLFGKRRAYQRKVAVADFDGICSSDILVFEPSSPDLLPAFLPYLVQSDGFFAHALGTSAGSLSPRTKWQELAKYELVLPPLDEQQRMVEVMSQVTDLLSLAAGVSKAAVDLRWALGSSESDTVRLAEVLLSCDYGISARASDDGEVVMLRMNNIDRFGELDLSDLKYLPASEVGPDHYVAADDILFNRTNSIEHVGKLCFVDDGFEDAVFASYLLRLRVDRERALPEFVCAYLQSHQGQEQIRAFVSKGVSQANVNATNLKKVRIPLPTRAVQQEVAAQWRSARSMQAASARHVRVTTSFGAALRERLLGGGEE